MTHDEAYECREPWPHRDLLCELEGHGVTALSQDGDLYALDECHHRVTGWTREWVRLEPTPRAVMIFLGY